MWEGMVDTHAQQTDVLLNLYYHIPNIYVFSVTNIYSNKPDRSKGSSFSYSAPHVFEGDKLMDTLGLEYVK